MVGDRFVFSIVFEGEYSSISYPDESHFEDVFNLVNRQRYQITGSRDSLAYDLQFFGTEDMVIGRKEIHLSNSDGDTTLYTVPVPIFFKSVVADEDDEFRPFKPLFDFARNWFPVILLILLLVALMYYLYRRYQNREVQDEPENVVKTPPLPFVNPLIELKKGISGLNNTTDLNTTEDFEQYYIRLGDSIRLYLKRVYEFPALEMTTREIIDHLHQELAPPEIIKITRSVLNEADMVKFANFNPGQELAKSVLNKAHQFIETASVVNAEKIRYMKYKYEEEQGFHRVQSRKEGSD